MTSQLSPLATDFFQVALVTPDLPALLAGAPVVGGFFSDAHGSRAIRDCTCEGRLEGDGSSAMCLPYALTLPEGERFHARSGPKYAQTLHGSMPGENDAECTMDCHEAFFDSEIEETGTRGHRCAEHSITLPTPRWRYRGSWR